MASGFIPLPMPDLIAYTEGEAQYPELWDKLRGCWVPGLFAGPVWDFSESKDGALLTTGTLGTKIHGVRTGIQSGEEFDGTSDYASITMTQQSNKEPLNGWTMVIKLRRYITTPAATAQAGLCKWGSGNSTLYPWTDGNLYISILGAGRIMDGVSNSFDRTKWHDLTVTSISEGSSPLDWNCYQDGLRIFTGTTAGWFFDTVNDQIIGASGVGNFFPGQIRHCILYNKILDAETIQRFNNDPLYTPYTGIDAMAFMPPAGGPFPHYIRRAMQGGMIGMGG